LKRSLSNETRSAPAAKTKRPKKRAEGQREMLLPISGKRAKEEPRKEEPKRVEPKKADKPVRASGRAKKAS
jgi:DNA end-binding protein Ku